MKDDKRSKFINVRYSESEIKAIDLHLQNTNFSRADFIRTLTLNEIATVAVPAKNEDISSIDLKEKIKLLRNMANNINQIAKYSNQKKAFPEDNIIRELETSIHEFLEKYLE
jgi:hypothetical protein